MLSREDNEALTRVARGTPMGELMRRYWIPAVLSSELAVCDAAPVRVRLLGERLLAFRDSNGRVGLVAEHCPHRGASLFLGRNEEQGLRCVYHGWKFDASGQCIEIPTEPSDSSFRDQIRLTCYPTVELGGILWAYLGPRTMMPKPPPFEWATAPDTHRVVSKAWQECNWLQAIEGGIDSAHVSWLHRSIGDESGRAGVRGLWNAPLAVKDRVETKDYGLLYASIRGLPDGRQWVRVYHWVIPFHVLFPLQLGLTSQGESFTPMTSGHVWVPMDDENTMVYNWTVRYGTTPLSDAERERREREGGRVPGALTLDFRKVLDRTRDWGIDRNVQRRHTFSGIAGLDMQDHAVQESMGPIVDRTREHLGRTDVAVAAARRILLQATLAVRRGEAPPGVLGCEALRATERIVDSGADWHLALDESWAAARFS